MTEVNEENSADLIKVLEDLGCGDRAKRFVEEYHAFATSKFETVNEWDKNTKYCNAA